MATPTTPESRDDGELSLARRLKKVRTPAVMPTDPDDQASVRAVE
jgi:hypothetical protein